MLNRIFQSSYICFLNCNLKARTKAELRDTCTASDAKEVIEIMKASMVDYYENELGELDFSRSLNGSGISKCSSIKELVGILQQVSDRKKSNKLSYDELKQLIQVRMNLHLPYLSINSFIF